jgi:hypothetical protein
MSKRSEDVRSIEQLGRLRRPPLKGPSRAPFSRRRRLNAAPQPLLEAGARYERTLEAVGCRRLLGALIPGYHVWFQHEIKVKRFRV